MATYTATYTAADVQKLFDDAGKSTSSTQSATTETPAQRLDRIAGQLNSGARTVDQVKASIAILPGTAANTGPTDPSNLPQPINLPHPMPPPSPGTPPWGAVDPAAAAAKAAADKLAGQQDAFATLKDLLNQYGLGELADWAWQQLLQNRSSNEILLDLYNQPAFKARFPAIFARQQAGLPPISPGEYVAYENQATQMMRAAGFPPGFYDTHDDFTAFIAADVSLAELSQRANLYTQAAYQVPKETRDQLRELYGVSEGGIAAWLANPAKALPVLQQQFTSSQIGGEASRQQFGPLTRTEAERLAALGVTGQQAASGFAQVNADAQLFQQLPGEAQGAPGRQQALGLVAGDAAAQQAVDLQARRRKAPFAGGGGFASSQQGIVGLGSAATN